MALCHLRYRRIPTCGRDIVPVQLVRLDSVSTCCAGSNHATEMSVDQTPVNHSVSRNDPSLSTGASPSHGTLRCVSRAPNTPDGRRMASISGAVPTARHEGPSQHRRLLASTQGLPKCPSLFYRLRKHLRCPVGGIGRHTWFRSKRESMGVRVPHRAPFPLEKGNENNALSISNRTHIHSAVHLCFFTTFLGAHGPRRTRRAFGRFVSGAASA